MGSTASPARKLPAIICTLTFSSSLGSVLLALLIKACSSSFSLAFTGGLAAEPLPDLLLDLELLPELLPALRATAMMRKMRIKTMRAPMPMIASFTLLNLAPVAGREGFEPPEAFTSTVFKTAAIDHSAISRKKSAQDSQAG